MRFWAFAGGLDCCISFISHARGRSAACGASSCRSASCTIGWHPSGVVVAPRRKGLWQVPPWWRSGGHNWRWWRRTSRRLRRRQRRGSPVAWRWEPRWQGAAGPAMASSTWLSGGMQGARGLPNVIACNTGINACKEAKQWHQALGHLAGMQMAHGLPNVIAYSAAISACVKAEHWHQALCLLAVMQMAHVVPNVITSLVTRCKPAEAALQVLACGAWGGAWLYLGPWSLEVRTAALQTMGHQRVFQGSYHSGNGAYWGLVRVVAPLSGQLPEGTTSSEPCSAGLRSGEGPPAPTCAHSAGGGT